MKTKRKLLILMLQLILGVLVILGLIYYVNAENLFIVLIKAKPGFLMLAFFAYLLMNLIFAYRIKYVVGALGKKISFFKALTVQYGGMLAGDFTPARSGYLTVPLILKMYEVPIETGFSCILGCQSIEFLIKMVGGLIAISYLISKIYLTQEVITFSILGIALMFFSGLLIALSMWSKKLYEAIERFSEKPLIGRVVSFILDKASTFQSEAEKFKSVILIVTVLTLISWMIRGFEWYFIGLALNIINLGFIEFFLLHPLITALSFLPLTPSGLGFQEGITVGILYLLNVPIETAVGFAILARILFIIKDAFGVFPLIKAGIKVMDSKI
ncbi:MAG: lysylphosphatidylglycerol synthase transmembrane domain-containing protein [Candidatus Bathyarchaeia archaeon]